MSKNLLEALQIKLKYPVLQKIDPNTQEVKGDGSASFKYPFSQAAIPAVLTALYQYSRSDEGADKILQVAAFANWTDVIFSDNKETIIQRIKEYCSYSGKDAESELDLIAATALVIIKENLPLHASKHDVRKFLSGQRSNILLYLPAALQMGEMLHENTFDDRTNKMEGPVSSLMHVIGRQFSDDQDEEKRNG